MQRDPCIGTLFIVIRDAIILVQNKIAIGAGVDAQLDGASGRLSRIFDGRPQRENGPGLHEDGHLVERGGSVNRPAAFAWLAVPEAVPPTFWQVEVAHGGAGFSDRIYKKRGTEQELVADVPHAPIVDEVHDQ